MQRIIRTAITTILPLFFGVASLTAAENTLSDKVPVYTLQEIVCTAERTPSEPEIEAVLPDMSDIGIVMATADNMLAAIKEEAYMLPKSSYRVDASRAPSRRPARIFAEMRTSGAQKMKPQRPTVMPFPM